MVRRRFDIVFMYLAASMGRGTAEKNEKATQILRSKSGIVQTTKTRTTTTNVNVCLFFLDVVLKHQILIFLCVS